MSPKTLRCDHAVDVGGGLAVEPGGEIPKDADPDIVKRLEADGKLRDAATKKTSTSKEESSA